MFALKTFSLCAVLCISWYGFYFKSGKVYHKVFSWCEHSRNNYHIQMNVMALGCSSHIFMCVYSLLLIFNLYIHQLSCLLLQWHISVTCSSYSSSASQLTSVLAVCVSLCIFFLLIFFWQCKGMWVYRQQFLLAATGVASSQEGNSFQVSHVGGTVLHWLHDHQHGTARSIVETCTVHSL